MKTNKILRSLSVIFECSFIGCIILYAYNYYVSAKKYEIIPTDIKKNLNIFVIIAIISGGNVLLEGIPGVGKTRLVRTLGKVLNLPFSRIQFTPDLMPSDVTGTNIIEKDADGKYQNQCGG